jgi:hypothetical protein
MKIAITGHTAGIGQALANILQSRGHEIMGLSKRDGNNIRNIIKIADKIQCCDMFINNAQSGYAQTELLFEIWNRWQGQSPKHIWCIGTMMTQCPVDPPVPNQSDFAMSMYRNQKIALDDAIEQLRWKNYLPFITMIRPGAVATQPGQQAQWPHCDVDVWAKTIVDVMVLANESGLRFNELALGSAKIKLDF